MLPIHIALVTDKSQVKLAKLTAVAAALQKQVLRDFGPIWGIQADVSAFATLEDVPLDYWPVIIMDDIGDDSAAGYHQDQNGQPYSLVQFASDWTLTTSHEVLEMLGDPFGRRMIAGQSPIKGQGRVQFLVEVCDPSEAYENAYRVNGIVVSDFYTPHFFDAAGSGGARYSFTNSIKNPRDVLRGGYLSWYAPKTREWWQRTWFTGTKPKDSNLGRLDVKNGNPRSMIDRLTAAARLKAMAGGPGSAAALTAALGGDQDAAFANRAAD
ncbi:MAG TPA: hypothetical protein VFQ33_02760, partial [Xanthobacteraceae bacterium]|nr:hypothetical protein [Xanthobacteraceae bacterium]